MRGVTIRLPPEQLIELERLHPGLKDCTYRPTSLADPSYNCLSWSVNRDDLALWPGGEPVRPRNNAAATKIYWPQKYVHPDEFTAIKMFLEDHGYTQTLGCSPPDRGVETPDPHQAPETLSSTTST